MELRPHQGLPCLLSYGFLPRFAVFFDVFQTYVDAHEVKKLVSDYLVIQLARLGDLLQSRRLVMSVYEDAKASGGQLHLAVDESLAALARKAYPFAEVHPVLAHGGSQMASQVLTHNRKIFAALAPISFERVYNLNRSALSLSLSAMFPPESVCGYRLENGQPVSSLWTRLATRWTALRRTSPMNLADFWAYFHPAPVAPSQVNPVARGPMGALGRGQRIGIALSGRESRRSLPPDLLARCIEGLFVARRGPRIILYGSMSEEKVAGRVLSRLARQTASRVENLCGKTAPEDLPEAMAGLDLFFTPDTGLMHMAAFLGVPVTAVFLSSAWAYETGPYGLGHTVWQAVEPCSPCLESAPCPHQTACRNVFESPEWQEHLAGRVYGSQKGWSAWPAGLLGLVSTLDSVGVTYHCVDGNEDAVKPAEREGKRRLIAEWLHAAPAGHIPESAVRELLDVRDVLLPDYR